MNNETKAPEETKATSEQVAGYDPGHQLPNVVDEQAGEKFAPLLPEVKVEETKAPEAATTAPEAEAPKTPEVKVAAAPRHGVQKVNIKKSKTFAEIEHKKQIESAKLWSEDVLKAQLKSERTPKDLKDACELELKLRKELREKKK